MSRWGHPLHYAKKGGWGRRMVVVVGRRMARKIGNIVVYHQAVHKEDYPLTGWVDGRAPYCRRYLFSSCLRASFSSFRRLELSVPLPRLAADSSNSFLSSSLTSLGLSMPSRSSPYVSISSYNSCMLAATFCASSCASRRSASKLDTRLDDSVKARCNSLSSASSPLPRRTSAP